MKTSDMDLRIDFKSMEKDRSVYRAVIPGLSIRLVGGQICSAKDLSAGGTGFVPPDDMTFYPEQDILLDILVAGRMYIQALESIVVRATPNIVACSFQRLTRTQESRLDKLILETQKRLIARRKAEEEEKRRQAMLILLEEDVEGKKTDPILL